MVVLPLQAEEGSCLGASRLPGGSWAQGRGSSCRSCCSVPMGLSCPLSPGRAKPPLLSAPLPHHLLALSPPTWLRPGLCQELWLPCLTQPGWQVLRCITCGVFPRRMPARTLPFPAQPDWICPSLDLSPACWGLAGKKVLPSPHSSHPPHLHCMTSSAHGLHHPPVVLTSLCCVSCPSHWCEGC